MALAAADRIAPALPEKLCRNLYAEPDPTDPSREMTLRRTPGSLSRASFASGVRGMWQDGKLAGGKILVGQGTSLSTYDPATGTAGALTGSIAGSDRGDFCFLEIAGWGLFNGALYWSDGSAITAVADVDFAALLSDAGESAFTSVATIGQRGIFTFGNRFGYTAAVTAAAGDIDDTTALNFYTAENSPGIVVAARVVSESLLLFKTQALEVWSKTGSSEDPFSPQLGMTELTGCLCRDGIVVADNSAFWVDDAGNVRRWQAGGSPIISEPWVAQRLRDAGAANIVSFWRQDRGHLFVYWRTPDITMCFDALTRRWHTVNTNPESTWRYTAMAAAGLRTFVGDATGAFDELSDSHHSEHMPDAATMGTEIVRSFMAVLPVQKGYPEIAAIRLESAKGTGLAAGQGVDPIVWLAQSDDGGATFGPERARSIGAQGQYSTRTIWRRNGRARPPARVLRFRYSDPADAAFTGIVINED